MRGAGDEARPRLRNLPRWRAGTLAGVYVLMGLHIAHWRLSGRTLAPLELNEVMYTLELGIVTAGFLFMVAAVVSAAIFGRFFCSWGCHILALEDLCAWLLGTLGLRPKPVRSRLLLLVAPGAMFYMFLWPQVARLLQGRPAPQPRVLADGEGWASFVTSDFWRNLPGPGIAILTFAVCGFAIVYLLGSRSFCRYACPYGVIFALADRVAPGKLVALGDCSKCGLCTAVCQSHVRVHEELTVFGKVVSPSCLKDLDCVRVCPERAIGYRFTKPSFFASWKRAGRRKTPYDFALWEEALMAALFLATLFIFRGLYGAVPFLMTLGLGGILAYLAVLTARLAYAPNVRLNNFQLKRGNAITAAGTVGAGAAGLTLAFMVHSAFIRYHEFAGHRGYERVFAAARAGGLESQRTALANTVQHFEFCDRWGLCRPGALLARLACLHLLAGEKEEADRALDRLAGRNPAAADEVLITTHRLLGELRAGRGAFAEAAGHFEAVVRTRGALARDRYNLAVVLGQLGRDGEALEHYRIAAGLDPTDAEILNNLGLLLAQRGDLAAAEDHLRRAIEIAPDYAHPQFNLGRVLASTGRGGEAQEHLRRAATLDPLYAELLGAAGR